MEYETQIILNALQPTIIAFPFFNIFYDIEFKASNDDFYG
jgi:hypothetical protein